MPIYLHIFMHHGDPCKYIFDIMFLELGGLNGGLCGGIISLYKKHYIHPQYMRFPYGMLSLKNC